MSGLIYDTKLRKGRVLWLAISTGLSRKKVASQKEKGMLLSNGRDEYIKYVL